MKKEKIKMKKDNVKFKNLLHNTRLCAVLHILHFDL